MPPQNNPYQFMNNPGQVAPSTNPVANLLNDNPMKKRIIVVAGIGIGLIIVAIIAYSIVSNIGKSGDVVVINVAADQSELGAIAKLGVANGVLPAIQNLSATLTLSSSSDEFQYLKTLTKEGIKLTTAQSTKNDPTVAANLTTAKTDGTFDVTFSQVVQSELGVYQSDLSKAYKESVSTTRKKLLTSFYNEANLLQTMNKQAGQQASEN